MATGSGEESPSAIAAEGTFRSAVGWSFVLSGGQQVFGFLITIVLAALLGPTAYGTVAMASVFILFTQIFLLQGLMPALIQRRDLTPQHLSSVFWFGLAISVALATVCALASGWWASVNRLPDLQPVIVALSVLIPVSALMVVQEAWLRRRLQFRELAVRTNISVVIGGVAGIGAALAGAGVWALVVQQITTQVVAVAVLWAVSDWRPSTHFAWPEVKALLPFTAASSVSAVGSFVNNQGDALIIGLFFGPEVVGLYRFGARIVLTVVEVLARSLQGVALPELSRLQHDREAIRRRLADLMSLAARTALPLLAVVAAVSPWFIPLLGDEWQPATTALMLLCAAGAMRVFATFSGPLLQALNRPYLLAVLVWVSAGLSASFFVIAGVLLEGASITRQVNGMALASVALFVVLVVINSWIMRRFGGLAVVDQLRVMRVPMLSGALALALAVVLGSTGALDGLPGLVATAIVVLATTLVAVGTLVWLDEPTRRACREGWQQLVARLRRAG